MGSTEYIIVLCFVITIWTNTVNADIDCRRFVFAPSCRGVSAKRSAQMRSYNSHRGMSDDFPQERHRFETEFGGELAPIESRRFRKRFTDLLKANLLRRNRSKDPTQYNLLLNSMDELMAPQSLETESQ